MLIDSAISKKIAKPVGLDKCWKRHNSQKVLALKHSVDYKYMQKNLSIK